jgi:glycosyltransferase involved in cell wall biosynthesis
MLSIIIPALNEEKRLPLLLESIKNQNFFDYEIILADAGSTDKTLEIAKKYGCKVIPGGLPAKGRNEGAKVAKSDLLFFCDADTILPNNFLKESLTEFEKRKLDIASFCLVPLPKNWWTSFLLNIFYTSR